MFANIKKTVKSLYYILVLILAPLACILATAGFLEILSPLFASGADSEQTATPSEAQTTEAVVSDDELLSKKQESMDEEELSQSDILAANRNAWSGGAVEIHVIPAQNLVVVYGEDSDGAYTLPLYVMLCSVGNQIEAGEYTIAEQYTWKKEQFTRESGSTYERWYHYSQAFGDYGLSSTSYTDHDASTLVAYTYNLLGKSSEIDRVCLDDYDARILYQLCAAGTTVVVADAQTTVDFVIPAKQAIGENCFWDPTNNSQSNPWYGAMAGTVSISKETVTVERGETINFYRYVLALDEDGNAANGSLVLSGEVDTMTEGEYTVTYVLPLSDGTEAQGTITYVVEDTEGPTIAYPLNVNVVCDAELISLKNTQTQITAYIESLISVSDLGEEISNEDAGVQISYVVTGSLSAGYQRFEITATDSYGNVTVAVGRVYILERQNADLIIDTSEEILEETTTEEEETEETTEETTEDTTKETTTEATTKETTTKKKETTTQKQTTTTEKPTETTTKKKETTTTTEKATETTTEATTKETTTKEATTKETTTKETATTETTTEKPTETTTTTVPATSEEDGSSGGNHRSGEEKVGGGGTVSEEPEA